VTTIFHAHDFAIESVQLRAVRPNFRGAKRAHLVTISFGIPRGAAIETRTYDIEVNEVLGHVHTDTVQHYAYLPTALVDYLWPSANEYINSDMDALWRRLEQAAIDAVRVRLDQ
jgi:glycerol-3-phosphate dehydrogenase